MAEANQEVSLWRIEKPVLLPVGDCGLLIRFSSRLGDRENRAAIAFAKAFDAAKPAGVLEIVPNLVSVLVRYDPLRIGFADLAGEIRLALGFPARTEILPGTTFEIKVRFGGKDGPDLDEVSASLGLTPQAFIAVHNTRPLRVLATGFSPGFVYCGFHEETLVMPRRTQVRREVPAGSILFAAGQTAIAGTTIPTGWHVIGKTSFTNFDPFASPPTQLAAGDTIRFVPAGDR